MPNDKQTILDRLANNRLLNALRAGYNATMVAYRQEDFVPQIDYGWETYEARLARYYYNSFYVHNSIYSAVNAYSDWYKHREGLYKHIRGLRNPISRLVNIEVAKIFGGFINYETFKDGALPITGADENLLEAIRSIWQWSNMAALKQRYPYEGATKGDSVLKVVDDITREKVYLEVLDPAKVKDVEFDNLGNVKSVYICYTRWDEKGKEYEYSEYIDKEKFAFFKNKEPHAYSEDGLTEWPNPYGFVPLEWTQHHNVGMKFGAVSFHNSRAKIDNLNDVISLIHDNIRTNVRTKYAVKGMAPERNSLGTPQAISMSSDARDTVPFLQLSTDGDIFPIRSELDITGSLSVVESMMREIEKDLPQLALQTMRAETGNASGTAIENLYSDAEDIIQDLQSTYLAGLSSATKMAISIGAFRRYPQFRSYNLNSYEAGSLDFDIRPKAIFQDKLSMKETIELTLQAASNPASTLLLQKLGYSDEEIQELENKKADESAIAIRGLYEGAFGKREQDAEKRLQEPDMMQEDAMMQQNGNRAKIMQEYD